MSTRPLVKTIIMTAICAVALLATATNASAISTVTQTNITTPANHAIATWDQDTDVGSLNVAGTAPGATDGDKVDILCYQGDITTVAASNVTITGGQFSTTIGDLISIRRRVCRLAAVPTGTVPSDISTFTGPIVAINDTRTESTSGKLRDYYQFAGQFSGAMDWNSAGSCGLDDSYLIDPATASVNTAVFYCNQYLPGENQPDTASSLTVDGVNAYLPSNLPGTLASAATFPALSYNATVDPGTGNLTIDEHDGVVSCPGNQFPVSSINCATPQDTGVRLDRSIVQNHDGRVARITDHWVSTDGRAHTLNIGYEQDFCFDPDDNCTITPAIQFPGKPEVDFPTDGQSVSGPFPSSSTIYAFNASKADGDITTGRAAITLFPGADSATFLDQSYGPKFLLNYDNRTVPAAGSLTIDNVYSQGYTQASVAALANEAAHSITPAPVLAGTSAAKAKLGKGKHPHVTIGTGRTLACPAFGQACSATVTLTGKVKLKPRRHKKRHHHGHSSRSHHKKRPHHSKYKTYKLGTFNLTVPAGTSAPLDYTLSSRFTKLFKKYKSMAITESLNVTAGPYASLSQTDKFKLKSPKFKQKHKRHKRHSRH